MFEIYQQTETNNNALSQSDIVRSITSFICSMVPRSPLTFFLLETLTAVVSDSHFMCPP